MDYESIELALDELNTAEESLTSFALHLNSIGPFNDTVDETKKTIGDLRMTRRLLRNELGGLRDAGRDNIESEAENE